MNAEMAPAMAPSVSASPAKGPAGGPKGIGTLSAVATRGEGSSVHMPGFVNMVGDIAPASVTDAHMPQAVKSGKDIFAGLAPYNPAMDAAEVSHMTSPVTSVTQPDNLSQLKAKAEAWGAYMALYARPIGKSEISPQPAVSEATTPVIEKVSVAAVTVPLPASEIAQSEAIVLTPAISVSKTEAVHLAQEVTPSIFDPAPATEASDEAVAARAVTLLEELGMEDKISEVDAILAERKQESLQAKPTTAAQEAEEIVSEITKPEEQGLTAPHRASKTSHQTLSQMGDAIDTEKQEEANSQPEEGDSPPPPPEEPKDPEKPDKEPEETPRPAPPERRYVHDDPVNAYRAQLLEAIANTESETNDGPYKLIMGVRVRDEFLRIASSDQRAKSGMLSEGEHDNTLDFVGDVFAQQGLLTQEEMEAKVAYAITSNTAVDMREQGIVATDEEVAKVKGGRRYASLQPQTSNIADAGSGS